MADLVRRNNVERLAQRNAGQQDHRHDGLVVCAFGNASTDRWSASIPDGCRGLSAVMTSAMKRLGQLDASKNR